MNFLLDLSLDEQILLHHQKLEQDSDRISIFSTLLFLFSTHENFIWKKIAMSKLIYFLELGVKEIFSNFFY